MEENRQIPVGITEREYIKKYAGDDFYKKLRRIGITGYIMYVILFVLSAWLPLNSLERLIFLGLTLGIHLGKSRVCAYILLCVGILFTVMIVIVQPYGCADGLAMVIIGVAAVRLFSKVHLNYLKYSGLKI